MSPPVLSPIMILKSLQPQEKPLPDVPPNLRKPTAGRKTRSPFSTWQLSSLEEAYREKTGYLPVIEREELAGRLGVKESQVRTWFQNRRARERRGTRKKKREDTQNISSTVNQNISFWPVYSPYLCL